MRKIGRDVIGFSRRKRYRRGIFRGGHKTLYHLGRCAYCKRTVHFYESGYHHGITIIHYRRFRKPEEKVFHESCFGKWKKKTGFSGVCALCEGLIFREGVPTERGLVHTSCYEAEKDKQRARISVLLRSIVSIIAPQFPITRELFFGFKIGKAIYSTIKQIREGISKVLKEKIKEGVTSISAQAQTDIVWSRIENQIPDTYRHVSKDVLLTVMTTLSEKEVEFVGGFLSQILP